MAKEKDWLYEEAGCANCGQIDYTRSKVPGLCIYCCPVGVRSNEDDKEENP